jgi:4-hydroxy-tetrahydrodipicolinate reductase
MQTRILINGATGKMGQEVVKAVEAEHDFELVAKLHKGNNLVDSIKKSKADIVIDFTTAKVAFENCEKIISQGARPVIGTTGFLPEQIAQLKEKCAELKLGGIIAPNFSIGAILMMRYAAEISRYLPHVEIIELHHEGKADAPSGTALKTCEMISQHKSKTPPRSENELLKGARGAIKDDIHIHSVRLPGLVAHQEIIFGDLGQSLTLRHDTYHREAFMPGVILACRKVLELDRLVYGLENLL